MRRKPVPIPLSLAKDSDSLGEHSAASASVSASAVNAGALTYPDPIVLGSDRPSPRPTLGSETALQVISPASSKSPKSPRSPFGKFSTSPTTTKNPQAQQQQQQTYPVDAIQPRQSPDDVHAGQHRRHQSPHRRNPEYPPLTLLPSSNTTSTAPDTNSQPDVEKHSRSASRFFNFGKGSRSASQVHTHTDSMSAGETMARGLENPAMPDRVSIKNHKNSGTSD